ncbi:hypothetical protein H9649_05195 [Sporosarcina sp. Sa2YVA2]|uniref:Lipoprotein n=1 Tax=Sporosarcina quadrami TaxID=2762234 RepID=A0ABR8U7E8_9BACL|nr:hypothetical protein [Sporosarcina quadrami]MBD7983965.1 hypothetical protein [Sporosarcina quadrami]
MKKILTVCLLVVIAGLVIYQLLHKNIADDNRELLKEEILNLKETEPVKLSDITPFEWDYVYSFTPYVSKDVVYETVGYKWDAIQETTSEGMNQLVFMKDDQVVCYVYGHVYSNGFAINMVQPEREATYTKLYAKDDVLFTREVSEDGVILTQVNE